MPLNPSRICLFALIGGLLVPVAVSRADDAYPDLDLESDCPESISQVGDVVQFGTRVRLRSSPNEAATLQGVRAWSLSLKASEDASIVRATTTGTDVAFYLAPDGYETTELTTGPLNEGVVSAVILSFGVDSRLPLSADLVLLEIGVEASPPAEGCREVGVKFVDGLVGSGQPVKNALTCGEGVTRRDDGGKDDNDGDGYEYCMIQLCREVPFVRGNTNSDSEVNVTDALFLLSALFEGTEELRCWRAGDVNGDEIVNLADVVQLLNHLFKGGPGPVAPYPDCGLSDGPETVPCASEPACSGE